MMDIDITMVLSQTCTAIHAWYSTDLDYDDDSASSMPRYSEDPGDRNTKPRHS